MLRWRLWLLLAAVMLLVGVVIGWGLWRDRDQLEAQELDRLGTQSRVIEDNLTRQLTAINQSLLSVQRVLPYWQSNPVGHIEARQTLENMAAVMSSVRTFLVTDAQGVVTFSNREELLGVNVYLRDYVQTPLKVPDPTRLYVSAPEGSLLNTYVVNLSRVLLDDKGQFAGVVSAAIDPMDVEILLNSVRYSEDMQAILVHGDGTVFISQPLAPQALGQDLAAPNPFLSQHLRSQHGLSHFSGALHGNQAPRVMVLRTIALWHWLWTSRWWWR